MTSYVIRDAFLLAMDGEASGTLETGDVAIEGDRIAGVGRGLDAVGAEVIDGRGMIAMPGLVDISGYPLFLLQAWLCREASGILIMFVSCQQVSHFS